MRASVQDRPVTAAPGAVPKTFLDGTADIVLDPNVVRRPQDFCDEQKRRTAFEIV